MKNCLIIVNHQAGKCERCSVEKVEKAIGERDFTICHLPFARNYNPLDFDEVAVCGGDGSLQIIMQQIFNLDKTLYYFPCGTLNDKAKAEKYAHSADTPHPVTIGKVDDKIFTYVYATGAFTEIGYTAKQEIKKKYGTLAYILKVVKAYRIHRIRAKITMPCEGGKTTDFVGEFNLIMFIKSPRCFGFHFNKAYSNNDEGGHLLLIRSPKHNGIVGLFEMFFPFFKTFFLGLKEEREGNIIFKHVKSATMHLYNPTSFCVDGEKVENSDTSVVSFEKTKCKLKIINVR